MMLRAHNTLHRFFHILDGFEPAMSMGGLFAADDATMHVAKANLTLTGPEEIDAWCERMRKGWEGSPTLHVESNVVLEELEPGLVINHSSWKALVGGSVSAYGTHEDVLENVSGEWLFRRRVIKHRFSAG